MDSATAGGESGGGMIDEHSGGRGGARRVAPLGRGATKQYSDENRHPAE